MRLFVRIALLATCALVIFINPHYIGWLGYGSLIALFFVFGLLYWVTTWRISRREAERFVQQPIRVRCDGAWTVAIGQKAVWGSVVITACEVLFLTRNQSTVECAWRIDLAELVSIQSVMAGRKRALLLQDEKEGRYVYGCTTKLLATLNASFQNE